VIVKEGGSTVASHTYNKDGIRTSNTTGGATISYMLEGSSVVDERHSTGGVTKHFQGPGIDNVLGMQDGAGVVTYLTRDHLGSVREHATSGGVVALRRDYDPWGTTSSGVPVGGWAFTGRESDADTALHYYRARYYDTGTGRFISVDPLANANASAYAYVRNNPVRFTDSLGLRPADSSDPRKSPDEAVLDTIRWMAKSISTTDFYQWEYGGRVCKKEGTDSCYFTTGPRTDNRWGTVNVDLVPCGKSPDVGWYHSHTIGGSDVFSDRDEQKSRNDNVPAYVWTPNNGRVLKFVPPYGKPIPIGTVGAFDLY
jgi:RHS repeat-associated protein